MEIYINNERTDFELENENNSLEIINAISDFAVKSNPQHFITNIMINNKEYSFADEDKLKELTIDLIKKIEIETGDIYQITRLSMDQIEKFLILLKNIFIKKEWDNVLDKIDNSLNWMNEGILQIIKIFDHKEENFKDEKTNFINLSNDLSEIIKNLNKDNFLENTKISEESIDKISKMLDILSKIKKWLVYSYRVPDRQFVVNNINKLIFDIENIVTKLENVPMLFQTGEDKEAMTIIQNLTNILEESIGLFVLFKESFKLHMDKYTVKEVHFEDFFKTVTEYLKELMESIQNNDSVVVGDLLEYEFLPNILEIKNTLQKIKKEAFIKAN